MCGLVMLVSKHNNGFSTPQQDIFSSLLYISGGFRGRDGAGVIVIDNLGNASMAKDATSVDAFITSDEYSVLNSLAYKKGRAMIGHNRAATRGEVKDTNAHPFWIDDKIVMVHNGTFFGSHKHIKDTEVDSEAIGHLLAENENVEEALKKVNAAYALMWYNVEKREICVIRNSSRPLYYMETSSSYIYASEESFLKFVIAKFNLTPELGPYLIKEHHLSTFTIKDDHKYELTTRDLDCKFPVETSEAEYWENYLTRQQANRWDYGEKYYQDIFQKTVECLGDDVLGISHGAWGKVIDNYKENHKLSMEPLYWVEDTYGSTYNGQKDYLVVGRTKDGNNINVSFKVYNKTEKEIQDAISNYDYTVTISRVTWRRYEAKFPIDDSVPMNEWIGVAHLQGYDPKPILELEHYVH